MLERFRGNKQQDNQYVVRPPVDIYETEKEIALTLEIPGVAKETLDIQLHNNTLSIKGTRKKDNLEGKYTQIYNERYPSVGYVRDFQLNSQVDQEKISAKYQNGVLKLTLVKSQSAQPQKIAIT